VEPDRAPHVQLHLDELAGTATRLLPTIIELISATTTKKGLTIQAEEDLNYYETGTKVTKAELTAVPAHITRIPGRLELHDRSVKLPVRSNYRFVAAGQLFDNDYHILHSLKSIVHWTGDGKSAFRDLV